MTAYQYYLYFKDQNLFRSFFIIGLFFDIYFKYFSYYRVVGNFFRVEGVRGAGGESYKYQPPWLVEDEKKKKHRLKHPKVVPKNKIWTKI